MNKTKYHNNAYIRIILIDREKEKVSIATQCFLALLPFTIYNNNNNRLLVIETYQLNGGIIIFMSIDNLINRCFAVVIFSA